jgi:hypothetical protein
MLRSVGVYDYRLATESCQVSLCLAACCVFHLPSTERKALRAEDDGYLVGLLDGLAETPRQWW